MNSSYEHIVLGVGGIGSAAAYWIAKRGGSSVLALEQYKLGHERGASEDHSRIIRHSYHTADYASLTRAAFEHVRDLEAETGMDLLLASQQNVPEGEQATAGLEDGYLDGQLAKPAFMASLERVLALRASLAG